MDEPNTIDEFVNAHKDNLSRQILEVESPIDTEIANEIEHQIYMEDRRNEDLNKHEPQLSFWGRLLGWMGLFTAKKRTNEHGRINYNKALEKMKYIPEEFNIPDRMVPFLRKNTSEKLAVDINKYVTGNDKAQLADEIRKLKKDGDVMADPIAAKAVTALENYCRIRIINNNDTYEMEMAFVDEFLYNVDLLSKRQDRGIAVDKLKELADHFRESGSGNLGEIIKEEKNAAPKEDIVYKENDIYDKYSANDYEAALLKYTGVFDDHGIKDNPEESNVKDIPLFLHEPNINDVIQGAVGDCWLMGGLTAIVRSNPQAIKDMFQDLGDGNVMVRIYESLNIDQNGQKIKVLAPAYYKLRKHYETGSNGAMGCMWTQLLEKALALSNILDRNATSLMKCGELRYVTNNLTWGDPEKVQEFILGKKIPETKYEYDSKHQTENERKDREKAIYDDLKPHFDNGGSIEILGPGHCLAGLDCKIENDRLFILVKDPFNAYHAEYTEKNGHFSGSTGKLGYTIRNHSYLNTLSEDEESNFSKACMGLSWWKLKDMDIISENEKTNTREFEFVKFYKGQ